MLLHHDPAAAAVIRTREQLDVEVQRLRSGALAPFMAATDREQNSRKRVSLDDQWMFCEGTGAVELADDAFVSTRIPHYALYDYGCYRRYVDFSDLSCLQTPGDRVYLCFTAVDYEAEIWWGGRLLGMHRGYFSPFRFDITDRIANVQRPVQIDIRVRRARDYVSTVYENHGDAHGKGIGTVVDDQMTAGAGILGPIYFETAPASHITDVYVSGDPSTSVATARVTCFNAGTEPSSLTLRGRVSTRNCDGDEAVAAPMELETLAPGESKTVQLDLAVPNAYPWTVDAPALYYFEVSLSQSDSPHSADSQITSFGFRTVERAEDGAVMINRDPCYLRGTTTVGCFWEAAWAGDEQELITQLLRVKALFANTLRVHVHVLPELFYECADRVGVMIYQDAPLQWPCFEPVADRLEHEAEQVDELIRLVRNHPSVIVYSLTNEMHHPGHGVLSDVDRRYLELADEHARSVPHGMLVIQDHNGPGHPKSPPTNYHEYHGYMSHTARTEESIAAPSDSDRVVLSEYGGSSLPSWAAAKDTQSSYGEGAAALLPPHEDGRWSPVDVEGTFYHSMLATIQGHVGRWSTWHDYWRRSQNQQARVLQWQTGRLRRDRGHYTGAIQHFFQNPVAQLYNAAMDLAVIDQLGNLTAGFASLREAFRPLSLDLAFGVRRARVGQDIPFELWVYNDYVEPCSELDLTWEWRSADDGRVLDGGHETLTVGSDEAKLAFSGRVRIPDGVSRAVLTARMCLEGAPWCTRGASVEVWPALEPQTPVTVEFMGDGTAHATALSRFNVTMAQAEDGQSPATVLVPPDVVIDHEMARLLWRRASGGARVVLLERSSATDIAWVRSDVSLRPCVRSIAQPEGALTDVIEPDALSDWNTADGRLVEYALEVPPQDPLVHKLATCGPGLDDVALMECSVGRGVVVICQLMVWSCIDSEPAAWPVLKHLLTGATS